MSNHFRRLYDASNLWWLALLVLGCATAAIGTSIGLWLYDLYQMFT